MLGIYEIPNTMVITEDEECNVFGIGTSSPQEFLAGAPSYLERLRHCKVFMAVYDGELLSPNDYTDLGSVCELFEAFVAADEEIGESCDEDCDGEGCARCATCGICVTEENESDDDNDDGGGDERPFAKIVITKDFAEKSGIADFLRHLFDVSKAT